MILGYNTNISHIILIIKTIIAFSKIIYTACQLLVQSKIRSNPPFFNSL